MKMKNKMMYRTEKEISKNGGKIISKRKHSFKMSQEQKPNF